MLMLSLSLRLTGLAPSLTPLFASDAANTTINTIEKSAISHFLVSYSPIPPFSDTRAEVLSLLASATIHAVEKELKERSIDAASKYIKVTDEERPKIGGYVATFAVAEATYSRFQT